MIQRPSRRNTFPSFFILCEWLKARSQTIISFSALLSAYKTPFTARSYFERRYVRRGESTLWLWYCGASRAHMHVCMSHPHLQKWSELHRLARLRIHPRSRWGVPGVRDQLGRTAGSISQKGLPTVSRWRHGRRWSDSSITNQNSWDRLRLVETRIAWRSRIVYTRNCDAPYLPRNVVLFLKILPRIVCLSRLIEFDDITEILRNERYELSFMLLAWIERDSYATCKSAKFERVHRSQNVNICDAFHNCYSWLLLIIFSCSAIDLIAGNSLRRYVAAPSLKTIKAGRLCSF